MDLKSFIPQSAEAWELYSGLAGADAAARELSSKTEELLNRLLHTPLSVFEFKAREALRDAYKVLDKFKEFGARDSEPEAHMDRAFNKFFDHWGLSMRANYGFLEDEK